MPPRRLLSRLHLWSGLGVGLLFGLIGLAGAVLVFHVPLLRMQHPRLAAHTAQADGGVLAALMARESARGLRALDLPRPALPVWQGHYRDGSRRYFAPEDGELLLTRTPDDDALLWLHEFHVELLGGETGEAVLGVVGCIGLSMLLIGLYLWWPKPGRMLAQLKVHANPPPRRWLSWHRSLGAVLSPLMLLATLTGLGMVYQDAYSKALTGIFGGEPLPAPTSGRVSDAAPDWPRILALAASTLPDARIRRVNTPTPGQDQVTVRLQAEGEWHPNGRSMVVSDRGGHLLRLRRDARTLAPGHRIAMALYPLHIGAVGGPAPRWATALAGIVPMFLFVTGLLFWLRRRGHRHRAA
ncbi:PepSY domain-containing protein [Lysobacter pythonis]|uniref:PepSY domain-containing protein n=1 Tax=Solilutibacter pythonis TaxID=2483112 RepID=A0A3M2HVX0_9GAMM|nr:PepSY-associated TM helix domain-containing protein [Lysobacter pythonis]RMH91052.1 PepSY domain-containing protein [Lysobacter pythonis]